MGQIDPVKMLDRSHGFCQDKPVHSPSTPVLRVVYNIAVLVTISHYVQSERQLSEYQLVYEPEACPGYHRRLEEGLQRGQATQLLER